MHIDEVFKCDRSYRGLLLRQTVYGRYCKQSASLSPRQRRGDLVGATERYSNMFAALARSNRPEAAPARQDSKPKAFQLGIPDRVFRLFRRMLAASVVPIQKRTRVCRASSRYESSLIAGNRAFIMDLSLLIRERIAIIPP